MDGSTGKPAEESSSGENPASQAPNSSPPNVPIVPDVRGNPFLNAFPGHYPHRFHQIDELTIPPPGFPMPSLDGIPMENIRTPHPNDVLCGRGGGTNNHPGNEKFRLLVSKHKLDYLNSSKRDKPHISRGIVRAVRAQNPPGRFLQKDEKTGMYYDISDHKAREKTSQALREGAPDIRKEITGATPNIPFPLYNMQSHPMAPDIVATYNQDSNSGGSKSGKKTDLARQVEQCLSMRNALVSEQQAKSDTVTPASADASSTGANSTSVQPSQAPLAGTISTSAQQPQSQTFAGFPNGQAVQFQKAMAPGASAGLSFPQMQQMNQTALMTGATPNFMNPALMGASNPVASMASGSTAPTGIAANTLGPPATSMAANATNNGLNLTSSSAAPTGLNPNNLGAPAAPMPANVTNNGFHFNSFGAPNSFMPYLPGMGLPTSALPGSSMPRPGSSGFGTPASHTPGVSSTADGLSAATASTQNPNLAGNFYNGRAMGGITQAPQPVVMTNILQSSSDSQQRQSSSGESNGPPPPPPLTPDMALRLVFAETISQQTAKGNASANILAAEKSFDFHLEAGLLGINPNTMVKCLAEGYSENSILKRYKGYVAEAAVEQQEKEDVSPQNADGDESIAEKEGEDDHDSGESKKGSEKESNSEDEGSASKNHEVENGAATEKKREAPANDDEKPLKKSKYEVWVPELSRRLQNPIERKVVDALICIGAIDRS